MTNKSKSFGKKSFSFILLSCFSLACGKVGSKNASANFSRNLAAAGVIGGQAVDKPMQFDDKVLYLSLGTKVETKSDGMKSATWQGLCTASAISPRVILTAAHCVIDQTPQQLYIILEKNPGANGGLNLDQWYEVESVQYHEKYIGKDDGFQNDLALLKLKKDMPSGRILKLAKPEQIHLPQSLIAVGFGTTSESSDPVETAKQTKGLHYVQRSVLDYDMDKKLFSIDQQDHKGFCAGDSGGPGLIYDNATKEYVILGVVSNTSMQISKKNSVDPKGQYSLCIGQGNYTNVLNPDLRNWLQVHYEDLQQPMFVTAL